MEDRLFFVVGAPRSGTTLLMRMLHTHPDIYTRPEPHLLTPLARLGYYGYVDHAPYDHLQAAQAARGFVADLPHGEADYLDALRAYADTLYRRMLEPTGKRYFVDKTPAYALELPFITRLYPKAKYVVLTRHPFAIFSSYAKSFFDDDWEAAHAHNPLLERYLPALAGFLRDAPVEHVHVSYEALVEDPEAHLQAICRHADLTFDPAMVVYGEKEMDVKGLGDPIGVDQHQRPTTASVAKWALDVKGNPARCEQLARMIDRVSDQDLETLGYRREDLWVPLESVDEAAAQKQQQAAKKWDRYHLERRTLKTLRKVLPGTPAGKVLQQVRFYTDVVLRDAWKEEE